MLKGPFLSDLSFSLLLFFFNFLNGFFVMLIICAWFRALELCGVRVVVKIWKDDAGRYTDDDTDDNDDAAAADDDDDDNDDEDEDSNIDNNNDEDNDDNDMHVIYCASFSTYKF